MIRSSRLLQRTFPVFFTALCAGAMSLACGSAQPAKTAATADTASAESAPEKSEGWQTSHSGPKEAITAPVVVAEAPTSPIVLGYFTNWAQHRPGECSFEVSDVDPSILTHINYAFAGISVRDGGQEIKSAEQLSANAHFEIAPTAPEDEARLFSEVNGLKKKNPKLRTFISVGGWAFNDEPTAWVFTSMVETAERRGHFIRHAIEYARKFGFDGVDIDWEFPGAPSRGGRVQDTENFTIFLQEFRAQMHQEAEDSGKEELLLTIASPAGNFYAQHQQLDKIHKSLNWINVMTYDYHGNWEQKTGANAPLSGDEQDIEKTVAAYKAAGIPASKIVLGLATYARTWTGVQSAEMGAAAGTDPGPDGPCGPESLTAGQVQNWIKEGRYQGSYDENTQTPFAYSPKEKTFITYDDARSYKAKLEFLKKEKLGGAMFWAIDLDDFDGGYPLIRQVAEALEVTSSSAETAALAEEK